MKNKLKILFGICLLVISCGCEKDDIKKREGEAVASFDGKISFEDVQFFEENDGSILIILNYFREDSDIALEVSFWNIEPEEGTTKLDFLKVGGHTEDKPTSYVSVIIDRDGLGESYFTDTTALLENVLTIDCITKNKVTGSFQVSYEIENSQINHAPWLPDKFSFTEGKFDARI